MEEILAMEHITKTYPGVKALDDVSISFIQGEVHAVMGENGAGKSTLMKILNGMIQADSGDIRFHGEKVAIRNPRDARALGIAMIHQELNPIKDLTVAENMFVGRYPQKGCFVDWSTMYDECRKLFEHWKVDFDPKQKVRTLSTAETQMLEILKAISYDAKLIIMDEPTSAITEREVQKLFSFIEELKGKGITIIIITHKIDEVFHVADRVSVLRDGKYIGTSAIQELNHDKLISMMVGREISNVHPPRDFQGGEIVLKVEHLQCGKKVRDVTFEVHKGEILGFAGIVGAGRTETLRCLFGLDLAEQGSVSMGGKEISIRQPRDAIKNGIAMVTENRKEDGLVLCRSIMENTVLPSTYMNAKNGILRSQVKFENLFPIERKRYPLIGTIACGKPITANEEKELYVEAGAEIEADFCLRAKGDSMIRARIYDGDIVFIRKQSMVDNGEIAAVVIDDEATLKRVNYYPEKNLLILKAENPDYEDLVYTGEQLDHIIILGKAVAFQSDVR